MTRTAATARGDRPVAPARRADWLPVTALLLCLAGLAISIYLTLVHYGGAPLACSTRGALSGCAAAVEGPYSTILGVFPVPVLGLAYFVVVAPLHLPAAWHNRNRLLTGLRLAASVVGVGMVLYLIYTELFSLHRLCEWCTGVHVITVVLFVLTLVGTAFPPTPATTAARAPVAVR